jgi:GNAT superfamily N-acetyltransferase
MPATTIAIRPPETDAELDAFFHVASAQFVRDTPPAIAAADFRRFVEQAPDADPSRIRGAFRGDTYLGGYLIEERWLRIGAARVRTGCIGVVVTRPEFRRQGVATALMRDAETFARDRGCALLMLNGLADFYEPFGYVDVFDATEHRVARDQALGLADSPYRVRPATESDAPAVLDLFERHHGGRPGSFARSIEHQAFQMRFAASLDTGSYRTREGRPYESPIVAVADDGRVRGYLFSPWGPLRAFGNEVAADDWPATRALLLHDARRLGDLPEPPVDVRWPLPPDGLVAMLLADHLTVRAESLHRPRANWMVSPIDLPRLLRDLMPTWAARIRRCASFPGSGLALAVDKTWIVEFDSRAIRLVGDSAASLPTLRLTSKVLLPLLFGFRNTTWAAAQPGVDLPTALLPAVEALFPSFQPWIAPTDGC